MAKAHAITVLFLVFEGKTELDYWVDAIVNRGIYYTRDDLGAHPVVL